MRQYRPLKSKGRWENKVEALAVAGALNRKEKDLSVVYRIEEIQKAVENAGLKV